MSKAYKRTRTRAPKMKSRSKSYSSEMKSLAFKMGQIQRGLKNPDSQVSESYNRGLNKTERKKKPLL